MAVTLTISIVLFNTEPTHLTDLCACIQKVDIPLKTYFIDHSEDGSLAAHIPDDSRFVYLKKDKNLGYGTGHNEVIRQEMDRGVYHLVVNPDVYFDEGVLEQILAFAEGNPEAGLIMPRILNPDGADQHLYKLLPNPAVMIVRRFLPGGLKGMFRGLLGDYEMSAADPGKVFQAPYLSGCFMWLRKEALKEVGLFDERYFLYFEDVDLSRRVGAKWKTLYYGQVSIYHYFQRGSYNSWRLLRYHLQSAVKYFNKFGWLDRERKSLNRQALEQFNS